MAGAGKLRVKHKESKECRTMAATVLIQDDSFELLDGETPMGTRRPLDAEALEHLRGLAGRYAQLERHTDPAASYALGQELYGWLDGDEHQLDRLLAQSARPLRLTVHCPSLEPSPVEWALLHAPWELLADEGAYLAADVGLQFSPERRLGPMRQAEPLDEYRLGLAFMAAAPPGVSALDYEAEEAAILDAVGHTELDLLVDESGEAEALGKRLSEAGGLPVLHLSCHGHHAWRDHPEESARPVLMLEDGAFGQHPTDAGELLRALRPALPRLLFLSACLTAATPGGETDARAGLPPERDTKDTDSDQIPATSELPAHSLTAPPRWWPARASARCCPPTMCPRIFSARRCRSPRTRCSSAVAGSCSERCGCSTAVRGRGCC